MQGYRPLHSPWPRGSPSLGPPHTRVAIPGDLASRISVDSGQQGGGIQEQPTSGMGEASDAGSDAAEEVLLATSDIGAASYAGSDAAEEVLLALGPRPAETVMLYVLAD